MSDLSIKVNIAGRTYPLTIDREEEEMIRKAAKLVDESVRKFQQSYAVKDKQDLLAMTALNYATRALQDKPEPSGDGDDPSLDELSELLDRYLP